MSLEGIGSYEIHMPNKGCNPEIENLMGIVNGTRNVSECINTLARGRAADKMLKEKDNERINARAEWAKKEEIGQEKLER